MARFIQGRKIGAGTYASVYEAMDTHKNNVVALKKIVLNEKEGLPSTALREISILKLLNHPNIIGIEQVIHREDFLIMVLEFAEYDLIKYIKKFGNKICKYTIINQLVAGVANMHSHNVIHRDLKPANILMTRENILKIADFGLARVVSSMDASYSTEVITLWYRPPELFEGVSMYSFEVDIWSLGCIIYEILMEEPLFPGDNAEEMIEMFKKLNLSAIEKNMVKNNNISGVYAKLVTKCLNKHPSCRITANEIILLLENNKKFK
ncbi:cell [Ecytonucleospora hepatopenaei]|uniref:Cyclin-dependent kinase 1 n=1 Tax=Ecytonucleospora hepatopenaei TaxID=646526 RepID=A0A1W0E7S7_9MICR|nr:cell [Ecytonucleospora hepatopenaei]